MSAQVPMEVVSSCVTTLMEALHVDVGWGMKYNPEVCPDVKVSLFLCLQDSISLVTSLTQCDHKNHHYYSLVSMFLSFTSVGT